MTSETTDEAGKEAPAKPGPKTFLQTMQDHHYGYTAEELTAALQECISTSERTGKATSLTLKLTIKPESKAAGRYAVMADVSTKLPPKEREAAIMYVGPDGNLTTKDPRQQEIPGLRVIDKPATAARVVEAPQGPAVRVG